MSYVKCQNILVNFLVHLLEHLSFWLSCLTFYYQNLLHNLKLIQSMVRVEILGICITSSILRVLLSGFWVSESQFPSPTDPFPGSWVSGSYAPESCVWGSCVPGTQNPRVLGPRVPGVRVLGPQISGSRFSRFWDSGSQVVFTSVLVVTFAFKPPFMCYLVF